MPILTINISIDVDVDYYEKKTNMTDEQIAKRVYECVFEERNALAMEARVAAIHLLDGEQCNDDDDS